MHRFILALGTLCALLISSATFAQADLSDIAGHEKKPHHDTILTNKPIPAAEARRLKDKLHRIRDIMLATPALKSLHGYDWETFTTVKNHADASRPVVASVTYIPFPYARDPRTGKPVSSEEGPPLTIHVNDPEAILGQGSYNLDPEARFTAEPRSTGQLDGFPVFEGQFVVIGKRGQPVFTPVSQERYLSRLIEKSHKELNEMKANFRGVPENPSVNKREIESRQAALKAARAEQEQRWSVMMPKWPDRVAAERAKFDAKEKKALDEIEDLKTSSPRQRFLKPFDDRLKALESELAGLSPDERPAPASLPRIPDKNRASGLAPQGATDGARIVTLNPALFDPQKSKSDIQLIVLGTTRYLPKVFDQVQQQLDKAALTALIE
jgi:hypothetical protein